MANLYELGVANEELEFTTLKIEVIKDKESKVPIVDKFSMFGEKREFTSTIEAKKIKDNKPIEDIINDIRRFDYIAFISPIDVIEFFKKLRVMKKDIRDLGSIKFAAIGVETKEAIEKRGILVDLMPSIYNGKALGRLIARESVEWGSKIGREPQILIPRAQKCTDEVKKTLEELVLNIQI